MIFHTTDETLQYFLKYVGYYELAENTSVKQQQKIKEKFINIQKNFKNICVCDYPGLFKF